MGAAASHSVTPEVKQFVESTIQNHQIAVFSQPWCPYCRRTKQLLAEKFPDADVVINELDERSDGGDIKAYLIEKTGQSSVPNIFINQDHFGGNDDIQAAFKAGKLQEMLRKPQS
ncbi:thioredoxin-like protein [Mycena floridula]|nr:thioredoxin-like protein [Mycena floridula]